MKILLVGGDIAKGWKSHIVDKFSRRLSTLGLVAVANGILPDSISGYDLTIWMPNIPNGQPKEYPKKDKGSILICSKVMREGYTDIDAVTRIFKMQANAVIAINKDRERFGFKLIDALGNTWTETEGLGNLTLYIDDFCRWTKGQMRMSFAEANVPHYRGLNKFHIPEEFIELNTVLAERVQKGFKERYFGNYSTRCMKLFPSVKVKDVFLFSPRNVDKEHITPEDFVLVNPPYYVGPRKYSVDAPCQVQLYNQFDDINFMIHGHAFIKGAPWTKKYYPCGDLREVPEITEIFQAGDRIVNLKNHGFLIAGSDISDMRDKVHGANITYGEV